MHAREIARWRCCSNRGDYWECPECHLQGRGGGSLMVLRERGTGDFKSYGLGATESLLGVLILKQSADDPYESDGAFRDEAEFRAVSRERG